MGEGWDIEHEHGTHTIEKCESMMVDESGALLFFLDENRRENFQGADLVLAPGTWRRARRLPPEELELVEQRRREDEAERRPALVAQQVSGPSTHSTEGAGGAQPIASDSPPQ